MIKNKLIRSVSIFVRLTRIPLSLMVTASAMTGYFLTGSFVIGTLSLLFCGVFLLAAGTSVLNQVQECRPDAMMRRTFARPIPKGEISRSMALMIAVVLIIAGTLLLSRNGALPMILGLSNIVFYNLIYTPLKTRSWLAIIPGALVGAVPPLIGWTTAGFYIFHPMAIFISTFVFLWQIPHFWLLMIKYGKEYELAGFCSITKMLSERQIKLVVFYWGVITSLFIMLYPLFGFNFNALLVSFLIVINFLFVTFFRRFLFMDQGSGTIRKAFILINAYAIIIFVFLVINAFIS